ncbi:MAG: metal ABC transporter permease [Burkholderiales bacterium]|nr:metal ABC transporter permease [Burkholderiales bacterium]
MSIINLFLDNPFLLRALVACIGISFVCPILGIFLMLRRMSLVGDAISHAVLPGVALGFMLGGMSVISMALGGLVAGLLVTVLAGIVSRKTNVKEDASFAGFYLIALATGVIIISKSGTNLDLMHILFGSILAVDQISLLILTIIASFSLIILSFIIRPLAIDIFDKNLLRSYGINAGIFHLIFLFVVVINVVVDFQVLGTVLVIGLMMLPASFSKLLARSLNMMLILAILSSLCSSFIGIVISYYYNLPTGPAIVLVNGMLYILAIFYNYIMKLVKKTHFKH